MGRICDFLLNWVWQRWKGFADVMKVPSQKSKSKGRLSWVALIKWNLMKEGLGLPSTGQRPSLPTRQSKPPRWRSPQGGTAWPLGLGWPPMRARPPVMEQPGNEFCPQTERAQEWISPQANVQMKMWSACLSEPGEPLSRGPSAWTPDP